MTETVIIHDTFTPWLKQYKQKATAANRLVHKHALVIQAEAARDAPYDTGALSASMTVKDINDRQCKIHDQVEYGVYQELGTSRGVSAKHFLGGACERNAERFFSEIKQELKP